MFFSFYSPPRNDNAFKAARDRLEEDVKFTSKIVSAHTYFIVISHSHYDEQISNICITLNEFPYIRYYTPPDHAPLGALTPHASTRAPPPPESSGRWRTNLARGSEARAYESVEGDYVTKLLAFMVQNNLDEHKKAYPEFGVRFYCLPMCFMLK